MRDYLKKHGIKWVERVGREYCVGGLRELNHVIVEFPETRKLPADVAEVAEQMNWYRCRTLRQMMFRPYTPEEMWERNRPKYLYRGLEVYLPSPVEKAEDLGTHRNPEAWLVPDMLGAEFLSKEKAEQAIDEIYVEYAKDAEADETIAAEGFTTWLEDHIDGDGEYCE